MSDAAAVGWRSAQWVCLVLALCLLSACSDGYSQPVSTTTNPPANESPAVVSINDLPPLDRAYLKRMVELQEDFLNAFEPYGNIVLDEDSVALLLMGDDGLRLESNVRIAAMQAARQEIASMTAPEQFASAHGEILAAMDVALSSKPQLDAAVRGQDLVEAKTAADIIMGSATQLQAAYENLLRAKENYPLAK